MKIVFFGSPLFAVPFLNTLITSEGIQVVGVVTQPDKPVGRGSKVKSSAVAEAAKAYGIPTLKPESLKLGLGLDKGKLRGFGADIFVVLAYGQIIPNRILDIPPLGVINVHPSLLPNYRGATPMQAAIREGDKTTGITIMKMDKKMDHGPILAQLEFELPDGVDYPELESIVIRKGPPLLVDALRAYEAGRLEPTPQDDSHATYVKLFDRDAGRIDWNRQSAEEIERMIRAYRPWPGVWTTWNGKRLKILHADAGRGAFLKKLGLVFERDGKISVVCKKGALEMKTVQMESSKPASIVSFANGHPDFIGSVLGDGSYPPKVE